MADDNTQSIHTPREQTLPPPPTPAPESQQEAISSSIQERQRQGNSNPTVKIQIASVICNIVSILVLALLGYRQNIATRDSINLAEQNFRIENRALIWLVKQPKLEAQTGNSFPISITIKNFGKTPTENLGHWETCFVANSIDINQLRSHSKLSENLTILPPNDTIQVPYVIDTASTNLAGQYLKTGQQKLFLYCVVPYKNFSGIIDTMQYVGAMINSGGLFSSYGTFNRMR